MLQICWGICFYAIWSQSTAPEWVPVCVVEYSGRQLNIMHCVIATNISTGVKIFGSVMCITTTKFFLAISRSICAAIGFLSQMSLLCRCCMVQLVPQSSDSVLKSFLALDLQLATCVIWCLVQCPTSCGLSVLLGDRITVVECMLKSLTWLCYLPQSWSFSSYRYFCANTYSEWHCRVWLRRSVLREHCISS